MEAAVLQVPFENIRSKLASCDRACIFAGLRVENGRNEMGHMVVFSEQHDLKGVDMVFRLLIRWLVGKL